MIQGIGGSWLRLILWGLATELGGRNLSDDHEEGLEEQGQAETLGKPEEYSENVGDYQDGADVDGKTADWLGLFDHVVLRDVAQHWGEHHNYIAHSLRMSTISII